MTSLAAPWALAASSGDDMSQADRRALLHTQLAAEYLKRAQYTVAVQEIKEALSSNSRYAPAYGVLGLIYAELHDDTKAVANFQQALNIAPDDSDINNNFGWYLCNHSRQADGIQHYMTAVKNPLYASADKTYVNAGQCAVSMKDEKAANTYFLQALRLRPDNVVARQELVEQGLRTKDYVQSRQYYNELQHMVQPSAALTWMGLRLEHALGNTDAEARLANQLKSQYPDSVETTRLLSGQLN
ncbi:type IV pilus biogenesis/stability protein PilW [Silvimonas iriomotensis]|nr:type IV pilus biogenesis/stability protein PilW [Silvimonas iriomotensis]